MKCCKVIVYKTKTILFIALKTRHLKDKITIYIDTPKGPSWPWSFNMWIYNYLCNQCISPLTLWVWILLRRGVLDTTLYTYWLDMRVIIKFKIRRKLTHVKELLHCNRLCSIPVKVLLSTLVDRGLDSRSDQITEHIICARTENDWLGIKIM